MKIKYAKQSFTIKTILLLLGLLTLLLSSAYFIKKNKPSIVDPSSPSSKESSFLKKKSSVMEVLNHYEDHLIFFSVKDEASSKFPKEMREKLATIGGNKLAGIGMRYSYAAVFQNGKISKEAMNSSKAVSIQQGGIRVESAGNHTGNYSRLSLNSIRHIAENRGLNLFVVNDLNQLIGTWNFDFYESETPVSSAMNWLDRELEKIEITLSEKQYKKLKKKRDIAIEGQVLLSGNEDLVPALLHFKEKEYNVKMRLKGDWVDHLQGDKWSFRVKVEDEETLLGMRKFSLHRPGTRNYAGEWLFHQVLADAGIMHLQYHFVQMILKVEGDVHSEVKNLGIYALEEGFDKQLIERNERREGVILKLDESLMWEEHEAYLKGRLEIPDIQYLNFHKYKEMNVVPFSEKRIRADSTLYKQYLTGSSLFRDFIDGKKKLSEVFDVELVAKYTAIANLLGANHALGGHNYRVFYNPVTSKLEPIGFDGNAGKKVYGFMEFYNSREDLTFVEAYIKAVEEITDDEYIAKLTKWPGLSKQISLMQTVHHKYALTDKMLIHNQRMLQGNIHPKRPLRINFDGIRKGYFYVNIENFGRLPREVFNLSYKGKKVFGTPERRIILPPKSRTMVAFKLDVDYEKVFTKKGKQKVGYQPSSDIDKIRVTYNTLGSNYLSHESVLLWKANRNGVAEKDPFQRSPNAHEFEFLVFNEKDKTITCQPGEWNVDRPLVIPSGYTFIAGPGCQLNLMSQYTAIFSYSPLRFIGTPSNPVEIYSNTGMGKGLFVANTSDTSLLQYCKFSGLSNPATVGWSVTGAINFYEADVKLAHCSFSENRCEDALNIMRSYFEMDNCVFTDINSDAFDGDFVTGTVKNCIFANIGNDAIDVSGSKIEVYNVAIEKAGDKGISAGEDSEITASHIIVKNSEIALASKDNSVITITNGLLSNNHLCFAAFQKKSEFGPASITADSIDLSDCQQQHLIENGSSLKLNGESVETVKEVKGKMYGIEFGKSSK